MAAPSCWRRRHPSSRCFRRLSLEPLRRRRFCLQVSLLKILRNFGVNQARRRRQVRKWRRTHGPNPNAGSGEFASGLGRNWNFEKNRGFAFSSVWAGFLRWSSGEIISRKLWKRILYETRQPIQVCFIIHLKIETFVNNEKRVSWKTKNLVGNKRGSTGTVSSPEMKSELTEKSLLSWWDRETESSLCCISCSSSSSCSSWWEKSRKSSP